MAGEFNMIMGEMNTLFGVIGKIRFIYEFDGETFQQDVEVGSNKQFQLSNVPEFPCAIDEVTYIEDTVYGVSFSVGDCEIDLFGNQVVSFSSANYRVSGTAQLIVLS